MIINVTYKKDIKTIIFNLINKIFNKNYNKKLKQFSILHGKNQISNKMESLDFLYIPSKFSKFGSMKRITKGINQKIVVELEGVILKNKRINRYNNHNINLKLMIEYEDNYINYDFKGKLKIKYKKNGRCTLTIKENLK